MIIRDENNKESYNINISFRDFLGEIKDISEFRTDTLLNVIGVDKYWFVENKLLTNNGDTTSIEKLLWTERYGLTGYYRRNGDFYKIDK